MGGDKGGNDLVSSLLLLASVTVTEGGDKGGLVGDTFAANSDKVAKAPPTLLLGVKGDLGKAAVSGDGDAATAVDECIRDGDVMGDEDGGVTGALGMPRSTLPAVREGDLMMGDDAEVCFKGDGGCLMGETGASGMPRSARRPLRCCKGVDGAGPPSRRGRCLECLEDPEEAAVEVVSVDSDLPFWARR